MSIRELILPIPWDQNSAAIGSSTTVSSGSATTTQSKELIYGASIGASGLLTTGVGFTNRSTANQNIIEYKTVSTTGAYNTAIHLQVETGLHKWQHLLQLLPFLRVLFWVPLFVPVHPFNRNITIFPNPVIKGTINLRFINQPAGIYNVSIINQLGQSILEKAINHISGNDTEVLQLDGKSEHGIYQVRVTCPDNEVKTIRIIY